MNTLRSAVVRNYALAGLSVLPCIAVQLALKPNPNRMLPLVVSLFAVTVTAYLGGRGPALFAAFANLIINCFDTSAGQLRFVVAHSPEVWRLGAFAGAGIAVSLSSHRLPGARYLPRVVLLFGSSLLLLIISTLVWLDFANARETEGLVEHTYKVLDTSELLLSTIQNVQDKQRGYLLTGDEAYLKQYRAIVPSERSVNDELRALTKDNAAQQMRLTELDRQMDAWQALMDRGIAARGQEGIEAATAAVRAGANEKIMNAIHATLAAVEAEEHRLLIQRTDAAAEQATRTRWVLALGTALLIGLLIFAGIIIENDVGKLRDSEKKLRRQAYLLDKAPGAIIVWELGGAIEYWNHGAEELYGFTREQAVGRSHSELLHPIHPLGMPAIQELLARDGTWSGELTHVINGREIFVESRMTLITEPDGRRTVLKSNRDVTEERRAREEVRKLTQELEQRVKDRTAQLEASNQELEAFAYSVSHDLRAPLRGIDGWSLALVEDYGPSLDQTAHQYLDRVRAETQRMGHLIDDLLKLSRLTRVEMQYESVDLTALAQGIASRLRDSEPNRHLDFIVQPGLQTSGDARLLEIVLDNLLSNAVKFTGPRTQARIEFGQNPTAEEAEFYVRDNGVGFDMAYSKTLFGAFQRLHKYTEFPGTGIGLATAQRVLRRHGGRIWAEAQPDQGATFYFTLGKASRFDSDTRGIAIPISGRTVSAEQEPVGDTPPHR